MRAIAESLRFPLKQDGISVSYVCPGGVKTGMTSVLPKWLTWIFLSAEGAANTIVKGCESGDFLIVFPFSFYSLLYGYLALPLFLREPLESFLDIVYRGIFNESLVSLIHDGISFNIMRVRSSDSVVLFLLLHE